MYIISGVYMSGNARNKGVKKHVKKRKLRKLCVKIFDLFLQSDSDIKHTLVRVIWINNHFKQVLIIRRFDCDRPYKVIIVDLIHETPLFFLILFLKESYTV